MVDEYLKKRALKISDIAEMLYLADGVLWEARHAYMYNEKGVQLHADAINEQIQKDRENGIEDLVELLLHSVHDLTDAIETTPEKILKKLSPIHSRILGMFRNGKVNTEAYMYDALYADSSVPDEWLLELFAMRVRDKIISFVLQENAADRARKKEAEKEGK